MIEIATATAESRHADHPAFLTTKVVDSYGESNRAFHPMQAGFPTSEKTMVCSFWA
jgi:hypothetical protein